MEINVGKVSSEARLLDPKMLAEIARMAARIVLNEQDGRKRDEEDRRLSPHASSNSGS